MPGSANNCVQDACDRRSREIESNRGEPQSETHELYVLTPSTEAETSVVVHSPGSGGRNVGHERLMRRIMLPTRDSPSLNLVLEWLQSNSDVTRSPDEDSTWIPWSWSGEDRGNRTSPALTIYNLNLETTSERLLSYYCNDLTTVPWTNPAAELNSLRSILPLVTAFVPLRNAVMAFSAAHYPLELSRSLAYKSQALTTFSAAMEDATDDKVLENLLATSLVLFNLLSVESGYGQWRVHLRGACQLLVARFRGQDVATVLRQRPLLHSIVLQISWYDTACAMLSLQPCEIPDHFVRPAILWSMETGTGGGMCDTVGCPESIYLVMRGIVNRDITSAEEILSKTPLDFSALVGGAAASSSDSIDRYCCEQAWKYGLVVYLLTSRRQHVDNYQLLGFCTELVRFYTGKLTSSSLQKQLLLPTVFAGAQVDDLETRQWFRAYCQRHGSRVKFAGYRDGLNIMEATWQLRDEQRAKGLAPTSCWADVTLCRQENQYMLG